MNTFCLAPVAFRTSPPDAMLTNYTMIFFIRGTFYRTGGGDKPELSDLDRPSTMQFYQAMNPTVRCSCLYLNTDHGTFNDFAIKVKATTTPSDIQ